MPRKKYIFIILAIVFAVVIMSNPLRWSEFIIKRQLLKETPIGTNMDSVIETLKSNENYEIMFISYENGFGMANNEPIDAAVSSWQKEIGKKSIKVHLGEYRVIFCVDVIAYYGFDEQNELIAIEVTKEYEAI